MFPNLLNNVFVNGVLGLFNFVFLIFDGVSFFLELGVNLNGFLLVCNFRDGGGDGGGDDGGGDDGGGGR
jgi:hypothetical protein